MVTFKRRGGSFAAFSLLHDWVCAADDTGHSPSPPEGKQCRVTVDKPMTLGGFSSQQTESPAWRVSRWVAQLATLGSSVVPSLSDLPSCALGFLQRTNSLEEKSRLVSAFRERQSSKNLLSCENSGGAGARFRRTETDFSNLFAQGGPSPDPTMPSQSVPHLRVLAAP